MTRPLPFQFDDGGRFAAGYRGRTGDCVTRALAIATGEDYARVYAELFAAAGRTPRNGVSRKVYQPWLEARGWVWMPTMQVRQGCTVHLRRRELPTGRLVCRLSKHLCAVIDGTTHDTSDPGRGGGRCVYGYFRLPD